MVQLSVELIGMILAELYAMHARNFQKAFFDGPVQIREMAAYRGLKTCALVCRTWRPLATSQLFRDFTYSFSYNLADFNAGSYAAMEVEKYNTDLVGYDCTRPPVKTFDQFYTFLAENPHICHAIRRLRLRGFAPYHDIESDIPRRTKRRPRQYAHSVPQEFLVRVLDMLPRLDALDLVDIDATFTPCSLKDVTDGIPAVIERLDTLDLDDLDDLDATFTPLSSPDATGVVPAVIQRPLKLLSIRYSRDAYRAPGAFSETSTLNVLSSFGAVETLRIEPVVDYGRPPPPARLLTPMRLRATNVDIRIGNGEELKPHDLVEYLARYPAVVRAIRRLHVDVSSEEPEDELMLYIRPWLPLMADTLEELVLQTHTQVRDEEPDLSDLHALRTLGLVVDFDRARVQSCIGNLGDLLAPFVWDLVLPLPEQRLRPLSFQLDVILRDRDDPSRRAEYALSGALTEFVGMQGFEHVAMSYRFRKDPRFIYFRPLKWPCDMEVLS
ncbi:hypothetical protein PHLGIDRAFT_402930 [Phlebiopsis gigantea 11061_1 CR5-6]|uniref:F-box domain-containing protein n=1 Tax=Phlebiopsis gigantea (strain 11061_1 CR5-6) TaxID=745531 RepID=A0A0C3SBF0_PHLG1|nr:hypothetical protein PHLGIDRAFT_402930 [Phlebiopsis gigantea 11061_1 CR5-6]